MFRYLAKNGEKIFGFLNNCIWVDCGILSLLRKEYLSLAVRALANSCKIPARTKRDVFELNFLALVQISAKFGTLEHVDFDGCSNGLESIIWKTHQRLG